MDCPFVGQIQLFAFGYAPDNWILCDGRLLPVNQFEMLYALLGTRFGGDGYTTFAVPNLQNAQPINKYTSFMRYYIAYNGIFPQRP